MKPPRGDYLPCAPFASGSPSIEPERSITIASESGGRTCALPFGIVCLGLGFGGAWGVTGALAHIVNHALAKSALFLLAGRIRAAYDSAEVLAVRGLMGPLPRTGGAFLAAMLALMGLPPFGLFTSEVMIFGAGFREGRVGVAAVGLVLLVLAFAGLLRTTQTMLHGVPARPPVHASRGAWPAVPVVVAIAANVLVAG